MFRRNTGWTKSYATAIQAEIPTSKIIQIQMATLALFRLNETKMYFSLLFYSLVSSHHSGILRVTGKLSIQN